MSELMIGIDDAPGRSMVTVRGDLTDSHLANALKQKGIDAPEALGLTGGPDACALWFSPDEMLVLGAADDLAGALAGQHAMVLDVSDARLVFRLTGAKVGEVLAKGAPCDCSDKGFPPGTVRRTHLAGLAVAIWRYDADTWEIACFRSFAHHLKAWLETAANPAAAVDH